MKHKLGIYTALMAGVMMLSASGIFARLAEAPAGITAFYRLFFASLALLPAVALNRGTRRELFALRGRELAATVLAGFFLAVHYVMYFSSLHLTTVSSATVLAALQPLFSMILGALFLNEKITRQAAIGCAVAITGTFVIGGGDFRVSGTALWGDVLALASGAVITLYYFFGQIARRSEGVLAYSAVSYSSSAFFLAAYSALRGYSFTGYPASTWHCFLALALVSTIGGQMVFNVLLRWISATTVTMGILAEPLGTCVLAWYALGERPGAQLGAGMIVIMAGLGLFFSATMKDKA